MCREACHADWGPEAQAWRDRTRTDKILDLLQILVLVRNFVPAHEQIAGGGWDIGAVCKKAYDLENKCIGIVGAGRIGRLVMERLKVSFASKQYCDQGRRSSKTRFTALQILT